MKTRCILASLIPVSKKRKANSINILYILHFDFIFAEFDNYLVIGSS